MKDSKSKGRRLAPARRAEVKALVSIPADVVLSPQTERPRGPLGTDRSLPGKGSRIKEMTWAEFDRHVQALGQRVQKGWGKDVQDAAVVGVAHGGVFVGGAVASALRCEFFPVRISRRSRDRGAGSSPKLFGEMPKELKGRRVLIVDDVAASGDTLQLAQQLARKVGAREVQTAALVQRPDGFVPDHVALVTADFLVFPWDYDMVEDQRFRP